MRSVFTRPGEPRTFRVRWRGYDRAEVDEFLRQTSADRQRLQEDLAQLEAVMASPADARRELERLAAVRRDVASCLETSIGALRTATGLLASVAPPAVQTPAPVPQPAAIEAAGEAPIRRWSTRSRLPAWVAERRKPLAVAVASAGAILVAGLLYQNEPSASVMPDTPRSPAPVEPQMPPATPAPATVPESTPVPAAGRVDGLVLTLTARRTCWIGTTLDGGQRLERMLTPHETIMVRATKEAVLRIGDATAIDVMINNQPTRPFGTTGQVVTARITLENYKGLLAAPQ